jgi:hypothetical protein
MDVANTGRGPGGAPVPDIGVLFPMGQMRKDAMEWEWKRPGAGLEGKLAGNGIAAISNQKPGEN